jgi:hypothetical protein
VLAKPKTIHRLWSLIHLLSRTDRNEWTATAFLRITELLNPISR